jgi:hypothetical protein
MGLCPENGSAEMDNLNRGGQFSFYSLSVLILHKCSLFGFSKATLLSREEGDARKPALSVLFRH